MVDIFLHKNYSYITALPDGIANCKYHGKTLIEIKCPFNLRNKAIQEGVHECLFIAEKDGLLTLSRTHRYYTQTVSKMQVTGIYSCYFTVWTLKNIFVQTVKFDEKLRNKVNTNLKLNHLYVQQFLNLNSLPIAVTSILSYLKKAKQRKKKRVN